MRIGYIETPYNMKSIYGKGRLLVHAAFDGEPYDGQSVFSLKEPLDE